MLSRVSQRARNWLQKPPTTRVIKRLPSVQPLRPPVPNPDLREPSTYQMIRDIHRVTYDLWHDKQMEDKYSKLIILSILSIKTCLHLTLLNTDRSWKSWFFSYR